jgi:nucleoside-diphosphate-sugar epimerase
MLSGEKILVTGAAGQIGYPLAEFLARENEVWGVARFRDEDARRRVEAAGVTVHACDLGTGDLSGLPDDFTYVLHLAALITGTDYDQSLTVNAEGTGLLLQHCRKAKAALVMSTHSVYKPEPDPWHVYAETDPLGDVNATFSPTYSVSKIGQEAVARFCSRAFDLPVIIARMNASYGPNGGLPAYHLASVVAGEPVVTRWDPCLYSPIYQDDINTQAAALLQGASVPATVVNWAGDEPVSVQEWVADMARVAGREGRVIVEEAPGTLRGSVADVAKRRSITGPCQVGWKEGLRRTYEARHDGAATGLEPPA